MSTSLHVIFNAHLDPVWMWPWTAGLDEALATCRSACDRLDTHRELFFTQGEAWTFSMVEKSDPALFKRICGHIESGRWEVVNGWWTQPDCNLPTIEGFHRQLSTGLAYVKDRFGLTPRCGFNPDSFGHCAKLPEILRQHGQDRYVFMRPQEHERLLPSRLFTWQSRPDGPAVTAFRIADCYNNGSGDSVWVDALHHAAQELPCGISHSMVFLGLGNHGGGPTEKLIRWVEEHRDIVPGARLEFSTVNRFFDAIAESRIPLPVVTGELQMHAVGCYTVVRRIKTGVRNAEYALARAGHVALPEEQPALERAWEAVLSHHFHDTLGGTAPPDAFEFAFNQLGGAAALAEETMAYAVRRQMLSLPDDPLPRLVLANPGADQFNGWCEASVYFEHEWRRPWRLLAADGTEVPYQELHPAIGTDANWCWGMRKLLVKSAIPAGGLLPLRIDISQPPTPVTPRVQAGDSSLSNDAGAGVELSDSGAKLLHDDQMIFQIALHLIPDASDTWSHNIDRYAEGPVTVPIWDAPETIHDGALMAALLQEGCLGDSRLRAEWRVHAGEPYIDLLLSVHWRERKHILKLVLPLSGETARVDGTPGMSLSRFNDGREVPLHDFSALKNIGVVCPDCFALDATNTRVRFTLLRAPLMAHHVPSPDFRAHATIADQGVHNFRFRFHMGPASPEELAAAARQWQRPPLVAELTRGMPVRMMETRI